MIILASTSSTRRRLLTAAGISYEAMAPTSNEAEIKSNNPGLSPSTLARVLAKSKAESLKDRNPAALIIGCDQVLSCDGKVFDKAATVEIAADHLDFLQGRTHTLHTALCCLEPGQTAHEIVSEPNLTMLPLKRAQIRHYLDAVGPAILHSVGCYHIEGRGLQLFKRIDGDLFSIQGLPLLPLLAHLRTRGYLT
jgi:septum formation protein